MRNLLFFCILLLNLSLFSQAESNQLRISTFPEVEKLQKQTPKPIVVFLHTDWCKICHGMKTTTFKNKEVINLLNTYFYVVQLDGEEQKDIVWFGRKFHYKPNGSGTGTHELAQNLASIHGKISYPTTTILNSKLEIDLQIDSYINSKKMAAILTKYVTLKK